MPSDIEARAMALFGQMPEACRLGFSEESEADYIEAIATALRSHGQAVWHEAADLAQVTRPGDPPSDDAEREYWHGQRISNKLRQRAEEVVE